MKFNWGPSAYRCLNGVFCVYKPSGLTMTRLVEGIQTNLANDLNFLPCYNYERKSMQLKPDAETILPSVKTVPDGMTDLSGHRLVLGPRYLPSDFNIKFLHRLSKHSSGVLIMSIGSGKHYFNHLSSSRHLKVYHVKGRFGWATDDFTPRGNIVERTTFHHIKKPTLDKICASAQASHRKLTFEYAGVLPDSQEAYEMAATGLVRPASRDTNPILYSIKCIDFSLPDFTLEIHALNEDCKYFHNFINDIGLILKSTAVCAHVRRLRHGYFTPQSALLRKYWRLDNIVQNIRQCQKLLTVNKLLSGGTVTRMETEEEDPLLEMDEPKADFLPDR